MAGCIRPCWFANKRHKVIAGRSRLGLRAGMTGTAAAIHFPGGNA
jgi:hypothetical protein